MEVPEVESEDGTILAPLSVTFLNGNGTVLLPLVTLPRSFLTLIFKADGVVAYLSTFENFPGVESARQLVSDILPIARGRYK